jgi:pyocin large subunit-like protein
MYAIAIEPTAWVMTTASLALKPSTSFVARLISDGLKRTALDRWGRVLMPAGGVVDTGPRGAAALTFCGVIGCPFVSSSA